MELSGKFIVLDGPDGCGKTTQIQLLRSWIEQQGVATTYAKDPGGSDIGNRIRELLLNFDLSRMDVRCETLLFMASRAQLAAEVIRPALQRGHAVVGDRYISSTCAYQAAAGFPADQIIALGRWAVGDTWPDLTIILDVPPEVGFGRTGRTPQRVAALNRRGAHEVVQQPLFCDNEIDAMERRPLEFHREVRSRFQRLAETYPRPVVIVPADRPTDDVFVAVQQAVSHAFG